MKILFSILLFSLSISFCNAQSSFKKVPKPAKNKISALAASSAVNSTVVKAFRFTGPFGGYLYPQGQVVTGLGYGWERMHFNDSTNKWYEDFGIHIIALAGGTVVPTLHPNNIISVGIELSVLNDLINIGPVYNFPTFGNKSGSVGFMINVTLPMNN